MEPERQSDLALFLLGIGLGGFVDGIVLHQVLQWHHMISNVESSHSLGGLQANTLADGLFHAGAFLITLSGALLLARSRQPARRLSNQIIAGALAAGWGAFNVVEGIVNHHLLQLHHVREDAANPAVYDFTFLALSLALFTFGRALWKRGRRGVTK